VKTALPLPAINIFNKMHSMG